MPGLDVAAMRRCVLAVSVLSDIDVEPADGGVVLPGATPWMVSWTAVAMAMGTSTAGHESAIGIDEIEDGARRRVETLLRLHVLITELGSEAQHRFHSAGRLVALPAGHAEHPGSQWTREILRGGALELGIGVHGLLEGSDVVVPLPPSVTARLGIPVESWWPEVRDHADRMGALASSRLRRDGDTAVIRPVGGCDVLALLSSRTLRRHLAAVDGSGLCTVAVPTRRRGWYDLRHHDPAFVAAAWSLTPPPMRGNVKPLLVTSHEVQQPISVDPPRAGASQPE
ncbi:hypothetical protein ACIB24_19320 [Spongisporangium articulatum]|uniref:Uncharacterized protein n=1 Tax=Spongisporangium articulatum TaxID=3362603 RepID=A0ABW8AUD7_9ACTN